MANKLISLIDSDPCVSLEEARKHLRMEGTTHDNTYITELCSAAQRYVEKSTKTAIFHQSRKTITRNQRDIRLAYPPFLLVQSVTVDGTPTTEYDVYEDTLVPSLRMKKDPGSSPVVVTYICGYEDDHPEDLKHAIKLVIATLYENRESVVTGTITSKIPNAVMMIMKKYEVIRL